MCTHNGIIDSHRFISGIFSYSCLPYFLRQDFSPNLAISLCIANSSWPSSFPTSANIWPHPALVMRANATTSRFCMGAREASSNPWVCSEGTLPTETEEPKSWLVWSAEDGTQGITHASQEFYHWTHSQSWRGNFCYFPARMNETQ